MLFVLFVAQPKFLQNVPNFIGKMRLFVVAFIFAVFVATNAQSTTFVDVQYALTGFADTITCDVNRNAYSFKVHNGLLVSNTYTVTLDCEEEASSNSLEIGTLAPASTSDLKTIMPREGTVNNNVCTLSLLGNDVYSSLPSSERDLRTFAEQQRLCGARLLDSDFDDDDCDDFGCSVGAVRVDNPMWAAVLSGIIVFIGIIITAVLILQTESDIKDKINSDVIQNPFELQKNIEDRLIHRDLDGSNFYYKYKDAQNSGFVPDMQRSIGGARAYDISEKLNGATISDENLKKAIMVHDYLLRGPPIGKGHHQEMVTQKNLEHQFRQVQASSIPPKHFQQMLRQRNSTTIQGGEDIAEPFEHHDGAFIDTYSHSPPTFSHPHIAGGSSAAHYERTTIGVEGLSDDVDVEDQTF